MCVVRQPMKVKRHQKVTFHMHDDKMSFSLNMIIHRYERLLNISSLVTVDFAIEDFDLRSEGRTQVH